MGNGLAFYSADAVDAGIIVETFRRFCKCEYGDLVTAEISGFSVAGTEVVYVTETLEIGEGNT